MKRIISVLLSVVLIFSLMPAAVFGEEAEVFEIVSAPESEILSGDDVVFEFSADVDTSSVTPDSVRVYVNGIKHNLTKEDISASGKYIYITAEKQPYDKYLIEISKDVKSALGTELSCDNLFTFETLKNQKTLMFGSKIVSALYSPEEGNLGVCGEGEDWLPEMSGGKEYYCTIDVSSSITEETLISNEISRACFSPMIIGKANLALYALDGDFTPGETPYEYLPPKGEKVAEFTTSTTGISLAEFDVQSYAGECVAAGKESINFVICQESSDSLKIANENTGNKLWMPKFEIDLSSTYSGVTAISPSTMQTGVATDTPLTITFSDNPTSFSEENITVFESVSGSKADILSAVLDEETKTATVTFANELKSGVVYDVIVSNLSNGTRDMEGKSLRFKTAEGSEDTEVYNTTCESSMATVTIGEDYRGKATISGKFFGVSEDDVKIKVVKDDALTPSAEITSTTDKNGYFTADFRFTESGSYKAYISSDKGLWGGYITEGFSGISYVEYYSTWDALRNGTEEEIATILKRAFEIYNVIPENGSFFEISEKIAAFIAVDDTLGTFSTENINSFRQVALKHYILCGLREDDSAENIKATIDFYAVESGISGVENYSKYSEMSDTYKLSVINRFTDTRDTDAAELSILCSTFKSAIDDVLLQKIFSDIKGAANYSVVTQIVTDTYNMTLLGLSDSDIASYKANEQNAGKALAGQTFTTIEGFKTSFTTALSAKPSRPQGGGGAGSGSAGTGNTPSGSKTETTHISVPSTSTPSQADQEEKFKNYFIDLQGFQWAEKEIEFLYRMNIIDGMDDNIYAPAQVVTREQLVKLLVQGLEFELSNENPQFADCVEGQWYYPYIAAAKTRDVVKGSGTAFGVGQNITREDMCTMAARALYAAGYKVKADTLAFADSNEISEYARDAVSFLAKEGIIKGMADGSFAPKANATRAEVAVFMYRISDYVKAYYDSKWEAALTTLYDVDAPSEEKLLKDINEKLTGSSVSHPYIMGTQEDLQQIKEGLAEGEEYYTMMYNKIKAEAENLFSTPVLHNSDTIAQGGWNAVIRVIKLMIVHYVEGDQKYVDRAKEELYAMMKIKVWTAAAQLDNSQSGATIAVMYDWLYDYLTQEERDWCIEAIMENCLDFVYDFYKDPSRLRELRLAHDWMNIALGGGISNHFACNNSNAGVMALAIAPLYPEYAAVVLRGALDGIKPYLMTVVGDGGGFDEPVGYFDLKTHSIIRFLASVHSALGTIYDYDRLAGVRTAGYYPLYMYGVGPFAFGDCNPGPLDYDSNILYFLAQQSKNAELISLLEKDFDKGECAFLILWYDKNEMNNIDENTTLPLDKHLFAANKEQNVATFRSDWDVDKGYFAAMYTGIGNDRAGHASAVAGAFGIDLWGERFITPIGIGSYSYPGYFQRDDGKRWIWYETRAEGNNCLVINPSEDPGQDPNVCAEFNKFESGEGASYAWTDLSGVYQKEVTSYKRGMRVCDSRSKIVLQDEATMIKPSQIHWSFTVPSNTEVDIIDDNTVKLTLNGKKMAVKFYTNVEYTLFEMAAEKLPTSPQAAEQWARHGYKKVVIEAANVSRLNLTAEFIPIVTEEQIPDGAAVYIPIDQWQADDNMPERAYLDTLSVEGINNLGFEPWKFNYNVAYEVMPNELPAVTAKSSNGEVEVEYHNGESKKAVIKVKLGDAVTYYEILFTLDESVKPEKLTEYQVQKLTGNVAESALPSLIDKNPNTAWATGASNDFNPTFDMDLGEIKEVKAIGLYFHEATRRRSFFDIYTSKDGVQWTKMIEMGANSGTIDDFEYFHLRDSARYIRFVGHLNSINHYVNVKEVTVYGE